MGDDLEKRVGMCEKAQKLALSFVTERNLERGTGIIFSSQSLLFLYGTSVSLDQVEYFPAACGFSLSVASAWGAYELCTGRYKK